MSPVSVTLAAGAQTSDTANYSVGTQGTGSLKAIATSGADADTGSYTIPVFSYTVAVTPDSGEAVSRWENSSVFWETFTVQNTGSDTDTYTFTCSGSGNTTCPTGTWSVTPYQATVAPGATVSVQAPYSTAEIGTGRVTLFASSNSHTSTDQGWFWVPVVTTGTTRGVTPQNGWTKGAFTSTNYTAFFVLTNPDTATHTYNQDCQTSSNVTCSVVSNASVTMTGLQSVNVQVSYSIGAGASGNGWVKLCVNSVDLCQPPYGKLNFTIWPNVAHAVTVTSATTPAPVSFTNGYTQLFTVRNIGTSSDAYTFSCLSSANVTCGTVTPGSLTLASLDTTVVSVTYNAGASGAGYVSLQASNPNANNTKQVSFTVAPAAGYRVAAAPDAKAIGVLPSTAASYPFTISNTGTVQNTYSIVSTCTGAAIASGCTVSPSSLTVPAGGTSIATVSYTSGGASTTGVIKVMASQSNDAVVKDSGWINLATGTAQAPSVNVSSVNLGTSLERGTCLTVALHGGAAECGDLRLAHGVSAVRTMGRARAPTLLYSSGQAHPKAIVAAEVTLPAGGANPDSVEVVLRIAGDSTKARWGGAAFSPGRANRMSIAYDALSLATGVYSYTLDVRNIYPSSVLGASPAGTGEVIVVNHSQDEFGAGWWLGGLERIRIDSMLWIGGDGSARKYVPPTPPVPNVWVAASVDRPDTLKKVGNEYVRLLPAKAEVWFDPQGNHVRTVSRLRHDTTWFHRNVTTGKLDSITVAPASQGIRYKFIYNGTSGLLDSVIAPRSRVTKLTRSGSQVTSIRDPDLTSVSFAYDGSYTNRIVSRTNRTNDVARYFFDAAGLVVRDSLDPGSSQAVIVTRLRPIESVGFPGSAAPDTADAYALIDGPRTDVGDTAQFWMERFGARRIRNALGAETNIRREKASLPALVTRVQGPSGQVLRATYDTAGHILTATDSGTILNGQVAVTRYAWNMKWDADTLIVPPEGDSTVIGIDTATGNRIWVQDATGSPSRVNFSYDAVTGLLTTVQEPGTSAVTSLRYTTIGNVRAIVSPIGFRDSIVTDNLGRDTLRLSPIDTAQINKQSTRVVYDSAGLVKQTVTFAPAMPYTLVNGAAPDTVPVVAETTTVTNTFDNEGRLTQVVVRTSPLFDGMLIPSVADSRSYDRAGRLLSRSLGSGPTGFSYDAAGNVVTETYRSDSTVTMQFDALNRPIKRIVPRRAYGRTDCTGHAIGPLYISGTICAMKFPLYANASGDSLEVPADTSVFVYDSAGNMVQADNRDAHIRRRFAINGALTADSLWMRDYSSNAFSKVYGIRYGYDRNGRRIWMKLPGALAGSQDSMAYAYSVNGRIIRVRDGANRRDSLTYTPAGRLDSLFVFAAGASTPGIKESHQYDVDGRLTARERRTGSNAVLQSDQLRYDARGKVTYVSTSSAAISQQIQTFNLAYDGLGAVVASQVSNSMSVWDVEEFRTDGLGNVGYQHVRHASGNSTPPQTSTYGPNHLLKYRLGWLPDQCPTSWLYMDTLYQTADPAGNVIRAGDEHRDCDGNAVSQTATNSYSSADNRLVVAQRFVWAPGQQPGGTLTGSWEEYRYDALGRRIMVRARRDHPTLCNQSSSNTCFGFVQRVISDGDQALYEQRTNGLDVISGGAPNYGTVGYVHALGMDQPVMLMDGRVIHYNWRGVGEASSWADGSPADFELGASTRVAWPAGQGVYYRRWFGDPYAGLQITWIGDLPTNGSTTTGQLFRRNRFFDPASGRFTQEDPIGLAGGLNLYGFGGGDPVNFADPLGLAVCVRGPGRSRLRKWLEEATNSVIVWDTNDCVAGWTPGEGEGFDEIQFRFGQLVGDSTFVVTVRWGTESVYDSATTTAYVQRGVFPKYRIGNTSKCSKTFLGLFGMAYANPAAVIVHELTGHGWYDWRNRRGIPWFTRGDQEEAIRIENAYHAARGQRTRCPSDL
jgi:RHS repeat-associated protein